MMKISCRCFLFFVLLFCVGCADVGSASKKKKNTDIGSDEVASTDGKKKAANGDEEPDRNNGDTEPEDEGTKGSGNKIPDDENTDKGSVQLEEASRRIENLLVFHVKDSMEVGKNYFATLDLGKNETLQKIKNRILRTKKDTSGIFKIDTTLRFTPLMTAQLFAEGEDSSRVDIQLYGSERQKLSDSITTWRWRLQPRREGNIELSLVVSIADEEWNVTTLDPRVYDITIYAGQNSDVGFFAGVGNFIGHNWEWLIGAVLVPVFLTLYTLRQDKKAKNNKEEEDSKKPVSPY